MRQTKGQRTKEVIERAWEGIVQLEATIENGRRLLEKCQETLSVCDKQIEQSRAILDDGEWDVSKSHR